MKRSWSIAVAILLLAYVMTGLSWYRAGHTLGFDDGYALANSQWTAWVQRQTAQIGTLNTRLSNLLEVIRRHLDRKPQYVVASWYGPGFHGRPAADGFLFSRHELTAAHKTLPLGTVALLINTKNGRWCVVQFTDRGPFIVGRSIDVSERVAEALGMKEDGVAVVQMRLI